MKKLLWAVCTFVLFYGFALADEGKSDASKDAPKESKEKKADSAAKKEGSLAGEVITATRLTLSLFEQPYAFFRHDRNEIDNNVGRTALERINYGPGVFMQHTGPGQTSPVIRGLTGKQSLLLLDGVRLSHATMRGGPNQYSAMVPDVSIDSIDVILGSTGVVSGSDGLTGALDFRLATAGRGVDKPVSIFAKTRIDSANGAQVALGLDGKAGNWRYSVEGDMYRFHDRVGGKDAEDNYFGPGKKAYDGIPNTAYDQWSTATRIAYDGVEDHTFELSFGHTNQNHAPRPDGYFENSGDASRLSRYIDPQTFTYLHLRDIWAPGYKFLETLTTTAWWHQQRENEIREDLASGKYRRRANDDRVDSIGIETQGNTNISTHSLTYGLFLLFEQTTNKYSEHRSPTADPAGAVAQKPEDWPAKTSITDGAKYNTYAVYLQDMWSITERWNLLGGLRYTMVAWDFGPYDNNVSDVTGSLRLSWNFRDDMLLFLGASRSFRAPNLKDLDGVGDRASSGITTYGNPTLDSEVGYNLELGWRYASNRDKFGITTFYTILDDIVQTVYYTDTSGTVASKSGNGEGAYLAGLELEWDYGLPISWDFVERLSLVGSLTFIDTEEEIPQKDGSIKKGPISRANSLYGVAGIRYEINENWWTRAQVRFRGPYDKNDVTPGDATDVRMTIPGKADGTVAGYGVFDISAGWTNREGRWATLTLENLANKTYRQLGSGSDAPGFNIVLSGGVRF